MFQAAPSAAWQEAQTRSAVCPQSQTERTPFQTFISKQSGREEVATDSASGQWTTLEAQARTHPDLGTGTARTE